MGARTRVLLVVILQVLHSVSARRKNVVHRERSAEINDRRTPMTNARGSIDPPKGSLATLLLASGDQKGAETAFSSGSHHLKLAARRLTSSLGLSARRTGNANMEIDPNDPKAELKRMLAESVIDDELGDVVLEREPVVRPNGEPGVVSTMDALDALDAEKKSMSSMRSMIKGSGAVDLAHERTSGYQRMSGAVDSTKKGAPPSVEDAFEQFRKQITEGVGEEAAEYWDKKQARIDKQRQEEDEYLDKKLNRFSQKEQVEADETGRDPFWNGLDGFEPSQVLISASSYAFVAYLCTFIVNNSPKLLDATKTDNESTTFVSKAIVGFLQLTCSLGAGTTGFAAAGQFLLFFIIGYGVWVKKVLDPTKERRYGRKNEGYAENLDATWNAIKSQRTK